MRVPKRRGSRSTSRLRGLFPPTVSPPVPRPAWDGRLPGWSMPDRRKDLQLISGGDALATGDTTLVEVVDRLLDRGIVIRGELWLTVADIDLVFVGADLLVASHDGMRE